MPVPKFFEEIVERAHKDGVKFSFDKDCMVKNCKLPAIWDQFITHPTEGKMKLVLCQKHIDDFDANKPFEVVIKK